MIKSVLLIFLVSRNVHYICIVPDKSISAKNVIYRTPVCASFSLSEHVRRPWKLIKQSDASSIKLISTRCVQSSRECNQPRRLIDTNWYQFPSICEGSRNFTTLGGICRRCQAPRRRQSISLAHCMDRCKLVVSSVKPEIPFRNDLGRWRTCHLFSR